MKTKDADCPPANYTAPGIAAQDSRIREWIRARRIQVTPDGRIRAAAVAELVGVNARTLRRWNEQGVGPASIAIGGLRWYRLDIVVAWLRDADNTDNSGQRGQVGQVGSQRGDAGA